ncbi:hypothetical protein Sango_2411600 [Sesamum angolense]|uniref:Uncharacterized protein n=1 Tax=Sesamum angolense TaxID=2727404 RepID=A0AAE1W793_9LAMI|nr:hypothetical protein Sango_2411600 [Sesamum angolense]
MVKTGAVNTANPEYPLMDVSSFLGNSNLDEFAMKIDRVEIWTTCETAAIGVVPVQRHCPVQPSPIHCSAPLIHYAAFSTSAAVKIMAQILQLAQSLSWHAETAIGLGSTSNLTRLPDPTLYPPSLRNLNIISLSNSTSPREGGKPRTTARPKVTLIDGKIVLVNTSTKQTLSAHCKSNGEDVGTFTIAPGGSASFLSHILVEQRTVASCSMTLGNLHGDFDVFDWDRDKGRYADRICLWQISEDGLSLLINNEQYELQFRWP